MQQPEFERVLLAYQDSLRTWGLLATQRAWAGLDLSSITTTFPQVARQAQAIYGIATAEALTAADEYMTVKAAAAGQSYVGSWTLADRQTASLELPSGSPYRQWIAGAQWRMLSDISAGMAAEEASAASLARTINEVGTTVYQRPRETTWNRFLVDSLVSEGDAIPDDLTTYFREVEDYANLPTGKRPPQSSTFTRWRRVPSPGACDWCLMLASRSDYTSKAAAGFVGGSSATSRRGSKREPGTKYHRACRCTVAMVAAGTEGQMAISDQDYARLTRRDADGNLPQFAGYTLADFVPLRGVTGLQLPDRADWARA